MKKIFRIFLLGSLVAIAFVGCKKETPALEPSIDSAVETDPQTDTLAVIPVFDTVPTSLDGFDIQGRWIWAEPRMQNQMYMTFRSDSVVVFKHVITDTALYQGCYLYTFRDVDSAKYRTVYDDGMSPKCCFYHHWKKNGQVDERNYKYIVSTFDNQNTMYMNLLSFVHDEEDIFYFYAVRY